MRVQEAIPKVVLFDLWKTLVTSHCREPVWRLQKTMGHKLVLPFDSTAPEQFEEDDEFLRFCLTTNEPDPRRFMQLAAERFGCNFDEERLKQFQLILKGESGCVAEFWDVRKTVPLIKEHAIVGVVSNLWPFPVNHIFHELGLGELFPEDTRIYSFAVGHRKPEGEIFLAAANHFGVHPSECLMVGDNLMADCVGATSVGMQAALIDRPHEIPAEQVPAGIQHMSYLTDLLPRFAGK